MTWFADLSLRRKFLISFGLLLGCLGAVVCTALVTFQELNRNQHLTWSRDVPAALDLIVLSDNIRRMRAANQMIMLAYNPTVKDKQIQELQDVQEENDKIMPLLLVRFRQDPQTLDTLKRINDSLQQFYKIHAQEFTTDALSKLSDDKKTEILRMQRKRFKEMQAMSDEMAGLPVKLAQKHIEFCQKRERELLAVFALVSVFAGIITVALVMALNRLIVEPLLRVTSAAQKIADGDFAAGIFEAERKDEVGVLQRGFRKMTESLKQRSEQLENAMDDLKASNTELQHFAYIAAHDLQEPLRTITSYLDLLNKRLSGTLDEKSQKYINSASGGAQRMSNLIDALLSYARVTTRAKPMAATDCSVLMERIISDLKVRITESAGEVTYEKLPTIVADDAQITQLFQNLIQNALKFKGEQPPKVHVSARPEGDEWLFLVRDNGIGLEMKFAERIFAIFQRLHTRSSYTGTGIGLSVCKKIVERHHGRIWVESEPGQGASFYFTLPATQVEQQTDAA